MGYLKYYRKEHEEFGEYREMWLNRIETLGFCSYVCEQLQLKPIRILFCKMKRSDGLFYEKKRTITFNRSHYKFSVLTVAHELAHYYDTVRYGSYRYGGKRRKAHTKKHRKCLVDILKMFDYIHEKYMENKKLTYDRDAYLS